MRKLVHLSDLHFGRVNPDLIEPILKSIWNIRPDLVVVSGDLTQRARTGQFRMAGEFLHRLPTPQIVLPGNHDIPLHNLYARFLHPLEKYRRFISEDLAPTFCDEELAVAGINTARSFTIDSGSISPEQIAHVQQVLARASPSAVKIVVTHHPMEIPEWIEPRYRLRQADARLHQLSGSRPDVFLAGHIHVTHVGVSATRLPDTGYSALLIQAATSLSTRLRHEPNSFNLLTIEAPRLCLEKFEWSSEAREYTCKAVRNFVRQADGWHAR